MERRVNKPSALPSPPLNVIIHAQRNTTPQHIIVERHTWPAKEANECEPTPTRHRTEFAKDDHNRTSDIDLHTAEDLLLYRATNEWNTAQQPLRIYKRLTKLDRVATKHGTTYLTNGDVTENKGCARTDAQDY
jgi:hypothetical protein